MQDAGQFVEVRCDGFAECSNLFTSGHCTDSVGAGLDGETGSDRLDFQGGEIHLGWNCSKVGVVGVLLVRDQRRGFVVVAIRILFEKNKIKTKGRWGVSALRKKIVAVGVFVWKEEERGALETRNLNCKKGRARNVHTGVFCGSDLAVRVVGDGDGVALCRCWFLGDVRLIRKRKDYLWCRFPLSCVQRFVKC